MKKLCIILLSGCFLFNSTSPMWLLDMQPSDNQKIAGLISVLAVVGFGSFLIGKQCAPHKEQKIVGINIGKHSIEAVEGKIVILKEYEKVDGQTSLFQEVPAQDFIEELIKGSNKDMTDKLKTAQSEKSELETKNKELIGTVAEKEGFIATYLTNGTLVQQKQELIAQRDSLVELLKKIAHGTQSVINFENGKLNIIHKGDSATPMAWATAINNILLARQHVMQVQAKFYIDKNYINGTEGNIDREKLKKVQTLIGIKKPFSALTADVKNLYALYYNE